MISTVVCDSVPQHEVTRIIIFSLPLPLSPLDRLLVYNKFQKELVVRQYAW